MTYSLYLQTDRLVIVGLNEITLTQLNDYFLGNVEHLKNGGGNVPATAKQVRSVYDHWQTNIAEDREVRFFILQKTQIIGVIGISNIVRGAMQAAHVGYNMSEHFQGQGYMTEALTEVVEFAFNALNLHRLMANYRPNNLASERVLQKLGFVREGYAKDYLQVNGQWADHILTAKINPNWQPL